MPHWCQLGSRPTHGRGVWLFWKWRDVVDQAGVLCPRSRRARTGNSGTHAGQFVTVVMAGDHPSSIRGVVGSGMACPPTSVAGVQFLWKWRDVLDQLPCLLVHAPDVAAMATVVVNASAFAQGRQEPDLLTVARWTLRDRRHGWGDASIDRLWLSFN